MAESTKIGFRYRRIRELDDITDIVAMLFPGNRNQQYAAARILLFLRATKQPVATLADLESKHSISRRTLQRTRAKLAQLGLIEHVSWMNSRCGGQGGWKLSNRMSGALRRLADKLDAWRSDRRPERRKKDEQLVGLLRWRIPLSRECQLGKHNFCHGRNRRKSFDCSHRPCRIRMFAASTSCRIIESVRRPFQN